MLTTCTHPTLVFPEQIRMRSVENRVAVIALWFFRQYEIRVLFQILRKRIFDFGSTLPFFRRSNDWIDCGLWTNPYRFLELC